MHRLLITGSRNWTNLTILTRTLDLLTQGKEDVVIVHGAAKGADLMAARWAEANHLRVEAHPVTKDEWDTNPRSAGILRNVRMVNLGAECCAAFAMPCTRVRCNRPEPHVSHGTEHCLRAAQHAGIETHLVTEMDS